MYFKKYIILMCVALGLGICPKVPNDGRFRILIPINYLFFKRVLMILR